MIPPSLDYSRLDPGQVLDTLECVGLRGDGRVLQLNSYENRVWQVYLESPRPDGPDAVVAKFYRPGRWSDAQILEEHAFALELAAAEVPVVAPLVLEPADALTQVSGHPPTLLHHAGHRAAVAPRAAGREPPLHEPEALLQIGRFIGRLHAVGRRRPFAHRHRLDAAADAARAIGLVLEGGFVTPAEAPAWRAAAEASRQRLVEVFAAAAPLSTLRLHGDCHPGNLLWREGRIHIVDLDDAMQGPAVQDLWMLACGDAATAGSQIELLLEGYEAFHDFDRRELALVEPLRTLRMLRHSAWLAGRWHDPSFPLNFPFFGTAAYWSQQTTQLREQLELMSAAG